MAAAETVSGNTIEVTTIVPSKLNLLLHFLNIPIKHSCKTIDFRRKVHSFCMSKLVFFVAKKQALMKQTLLVLFCTLMASFCNGNRFYCI